MPIEIEYGLKNDIVNESRVPQGWLADKRTPPLLNPAAIETDEALARVAKCYLDNAILCLNEAIRRGLKVGAELDNVITAHAGGTTSRKFAIHEFYISKDLIKC